MSTRFANRLAVWLLFASAAAALVGPSHSQPAPRKLSVLLMVADDLNHNLGCYGHPFVKSPNIDRLARRGVRFDRAYCQYPVCNPSRTSFLSGLRPETTRVMDNRTPPRAHLKDAVFLPQHFREQGYFTARVGKIFHDTGVLREGRQTRSMDDAASWTLSEDEMIEASRHDLEKRVVREQRFEGQSDPQPWAAVDAPDNMLGDGIVARRVAELLERHRDQPFFIAAGFRRPHVPLIAPRRYFDLYPPGKMRLPHAPPDDRQDIPPPALTHTPGDEQVTAEQQREIIAAYDASVSFMDAQVGVVLAALDRLKLWDQVVVVFVSDHGYHLGEHGGLWRKLTLFEEVARAPLIIAAPGKRSGRASPRLVELVDLYPTLTSLCGLPTPAGLEGTSLAPLLDDPNRGWKRAAFTVVRRSDLLGRSVRTEAYRYTEWGDEKIAELYDHRADPREHTNLAHDPRHAATRAEMRRVLQEEWRAAVPGGAR